jgi:hypothetical protein
LARQDFSHTHINALNDWELRVTEYLADLRAGVEELRNAAPKNEEERHEVFLLKKRIVDTLVERATIDKNRNVNVQIRLNLLGILDEDSGKNDPSAVQTRRGGIYTRIFDIYRAGQILIEL